jgi:hypothetical protein
LIVLECDAGEGWRKSVGPIVLANKYYKEPRRVGISSIQEKKRKANWIGHILRRNCLPKHVIEGKMEGKIGVTGRRGRRRKQLLDDHKEGRGYWKLN